MNKTWTRSTWNCTTIPTWQCQGGLTLISMAFFEWAKALILVVRDAFTEESIDRNPENCFELAEKSVMSNCSLRNKFANICSNQSFNSVHISERAINTAFDIIVPKVCHSRFGAVFCQWKAREVKKHENMALRAKLKATSSKKDSKKEVTKKVTPESSGATRKREHEPSESEPSKRARPEPQFDNRDDAEMAVLDVPTPTVNPSNIK